ncbi:ribonuclease H-like domain-containing protein [Tanacetum coccineum]
MHYPSSGNGNNSHESRSARRQCRQLVECTYSDFLKCQPLNFKGTEGIVGLTQWFKKMESVFHISNCTVACQIKFATCTLQGNALTWWNSHVKTVSHEVAYGMTWKTLKKMMTDKYYPRGEIKKLEIELWNLKVKSTNVMIYNQHFLALMCGRMFPEESDEVEKYVGGLPDMIQGSVMASKPKTMQDAIEFATKLVDQKICTFADSGMVNAQARTDAVGTVGQTHTPIPSRVENGYAPIVTKIVDGKETVIPPTSVEEKAQRRAELKARSTFTNSATRAVNTAQGVNTASTQGVVDSSTTVENLSDACDGFGYDWSDQAEEGTTNFALMTYPSTSSSSSTNSEVSNCCSSCLECVKDLKEQNEQLVKDLRTARISGVSYKTGLESVEARLLVFKKNESVYEEDIKLLEREIYLRDLDITELKRKLELATKEKDKVQLTVQNFETSSKSLSKLLDSQIMDKCKTGLGYNAIPPPYTGNFMPPKPDLVYPSLDDFVEVNESVSESIVEKPTVETNEPETARKENEALIIED